MSQEEFEKREKRIRYNFASMIMLLAATTLMVVAGVAYILIMMLL